MQLSIKNFAQIESLDINFGAPGDLTILVGQQATGKSLALQWLKLANDSLSVKQDWARYGTNWKVPGQELRPLDMFFGEGLGQGYREDTTDIALNGKPLRLKTLFNTAPGRGHNDTAQESLYYIPAHRALLLAAGLPKTFQQHVSGTPYVARAQSERLVQWLSNSTQAIFPIKTKLSNELRELFNEAIFHNAALNIDKTSPQSRMILSVGPTGEIPYMAWTAGQREFVPLLIALYELLPSGTTNRLEHIETVVLEEPELGLHPKALFALGIAVLHLMARGYRVVVSTHSPLMVDFAWALGHLRQALNSKKEAAQNKHFLSAFALKNTAANKALAEKVLKSEARTYYLTYKKSSSDGLSRVRSQDISDLKTYSPNPDESSWGELLSYSTHMAQVVSQLNMDVSN